MRKKVSCVLKWLVVACSLGGIVLAMFFAQRDGYNHWANRPMYFTTQSNIWVGITFLILAIVPFTKAKDNKKFMNRLYIFKYIFTVSITITGLVFCCLLAPFADEHSYDAWTLSSFLTHVFTPAFAIIDFFLDDYDIVFRKRDILYTTLPPFYYFIFASILGILGIDFGRGDPFPYFFLNYRSPAGFFGFSDQPPYIVGSFYWILLMLLLVLGFGLLYARLHPTSIRIRKEKKKQKTTENK